MAERGGADQFAVSRSYASITRANLFTVFNLILAAFAVLTLVGDWRAALLLGILVATTASGVIQEFAPNGRSLASRWWSHRTAGDVQRDGAVYAVPGAEAVDGDLAATQAGDQVAADGKFRRACDHRLDESVPSGAWDSVARVPGEVPRRAPQVARWCVADDHRPASVGRLDWIRSVWMVASPNSVTSTTYPSSWIVSPTSGSRPNSSITCPPIVSS